MQEINHLVALFRPGVMDSDQLGVYLRRRANEEVVTYPSPDLEVALRDTFGVCIFQEDMMQLAVKFAGYSLVESENLRKAISKKDPKMMAAHKDKFIAGAQALGRENVEQVWQTVEVGARYNWNKAHAAAYGQITYACAFLSANHPLHFFKSLIDHAKDEDKPTYLHEAMHRGIQILAPDINRSAEQPSIDGNSIRLGLLSMKGIGPSFAEKIRKNRPYTCMAEVLKKVNKTAVTVMHAAHALEGIPDHDTFTPVAKADEVQVLGISLGGLLKEYKDVVDRIKAKPMDQISGIEPAVARVIDVNKRFDRREQEMAFVTVLDVYGGRYDVVEFAGAWEKYKPKKGETYAMTMSPTGSGLQILAIKPVEDYRK
jgi:DNA polymerase III alpha subunit